MEREIIRIDEDKCDGCGRCCQGCPEGALQLIDGKARLVSEITCDGLGACVGECPQGAITVEKRTAAPYDERAALQQTLAKGTGTLRAHLRHLYDHGQTTFLNQALAYLGELGLALPDYQETLVGHGCPGSAARTLLRPAAKEETRRQPLVSQLTHWPVQLHLISPQHAAFSGSDLLVAADCTAFSMADFNQQWLPGKKLVVACPKLDQGQEIYLHKLQALIDEAEVNTITVLIMEVPCCGGLVRLVQTAASRAHRHVPIKRVVVGLDGEIRHQEWIDAPTENAAGECSTG